MSEEITSEHRQLFETVLKLKTVEDCQILFDDLCTYKEVDAMAGRIKAAELLMKGETYGEIINKIDISSATLSRVSKCVKYGKGYKKFVEVKKE